MTQIKLRRDTAANFTSKNPVLGIGEPAYETDTKKLKIGDGTTAYTQLEYFSAGGGGSTNISATLPLKIVDGVISLEVDGQTIQIVDGKLHANLDELGNEVNSLSDRVTAVEADVLTKENKITTTGALSLQEKIISNLTNMTETETQITPNTKQPFTVNESEFYFSSPTYNAPQCYIAIPYQFGQWLKIPSGYRIEPSVFFGHFLEDGDFLITAVFKGRYYDTSVPIYGGIVRGRAPVSFSTYSGKFYLNSYASVSEKAMNSDIIFTETDPCAYLQLIDNTSNNNIICGSFNYGYGPNSSSIKGYAETHVVYNRDLTNYTVQDFVRDTTTALIMSPSASYPILKSAVGLYAATGRLGWNQDGYNQLKANLGENLFDLTKSQVNNYLELNLGSGLSVVDGKLTASDGLELCDTDIVIRDDKKMFTQLQQMRRSTFDKSKFTVVGNPTITDDGVASGFGPSSYLNTGYILNPEGDWSVKVKFRTGESMVNQHIVAAAPNEHSGLVIQLRRQSDTDTYIRVSAGNGSNGYVFEAGSINIVDKINTDFDVEVNYLSGVYSFIVNGVTVNTSTSSDKMISTGAIIIGKSPQWNEPFLGSIDLKQFSITVDGKEVFSGNKTGIDVINNIEIPYTLSKTGSKIVDGVYRDRVIDLYEQEGQAGYYTIDEPNKNFTLPMGEIYGMIGQRSLTSSTVTETNRVDIYSDKTCLICGKVATAGTINLPIELVNNNYFITLSTSAKTATSFTTTATGDYILIGKVA